jgi:hypothetical protein
MKETTPRQRYISRVPRRVPDGLALVHNFMPTPAQAANPGLDGYRIFYVPLPFKGDWKRMKPCKCGAYPHLGDHYLSRTDMKIPRWMQVRSNPKPLDTFERLTARKLSRHEISSQMMSIHGIDAASKRVISKAQKMGVGERPGHANLNI